jgi:hypothetical protein
VSAVRLIWKDDRALALGRPDPEQLKALRRHRDELLPILEAFGDVEIELRRKPAPDWERVRELMRHGRPVRKRSPVKRSARA